MDNVYDKHYQRTNFFENFYAAVRHWDSVTRSASIGQLGWLLCHGVAVWQVVVMMSACFGLGMLPEALSWTIICHNCERVVCN